VRVIATAVVLVAAAVVEVLADVTEVAAHDESEDVAAVAAVVAVVAALASSSPVRSAAWAMAPPMATNAAVLTTAVIRRARRAG
jgi:hypothetical protein